MTKKNSLVIIITLALILVLCSGCESSNAETSALTYEPSIQEDNTVAGLILLSNTHDKKDSYFETYILYDSETHVMYALVRDYNSVAAAFGFFNLVDANGMPRLYNSENENVGTLILLSDTHDKKDSHLETYILYDSETHVMYALVRDYNTVAAAFGTSILLNSDGSPRLYKP